ncbi:MAG TPA: gliding motility-associated C-terminal domain-containing protein, partial [Flavobacterium sp.]|nr:gliding motility-associated C-terminal domain-containing protein [Flavobacterium sp.]
ENAPGYTYRRIPTATVPSLVWNPDDWIAIDPQDYSDVGYYEYISVSSYEYSIDDINYQDGITFSDLQPGTYVVTVRDTNTLCISLPTIVVIEDAPISENPEFEFENELTICSGSEVFVLPTTSENGISGSWLPENIDNTQSGTYTFTPDNECSESFTLIVTVNSLPEIPVGDSTQSICSFTTVIFELQDLSVVGSNLQWYTDENLETPLLPSTPLVNNTIYYVTQTVDGCESEPLAVLVFLNTVVTPEFEFANQFLICYGSEVSALPTTSLNGISGSWLPENIDNTQSGIYTFTPNNECAESFSTQITVNPLPEIPTGNSTQSICSDATVIFNLTDLEVFGSNLQWYADETLEMPILANTPLVNNTIYYVTQTVDGCESEPLAILVLLNTVITPEFEFDNQFSICYGSDVIVLPTTSQNGIDGNWLPENIDNTQSGTYTFTPDNECAESFSLQISVSQSFDFDIEWACLNETYQLQLVNIPENALVEWTLESGQTIGNNTFFNVTQYLSSGSEALPLTFYAHITNEQGCVETKSFIVESVHCGIQKGISPNGDFKNDSFDLSLLNVKHLSIFSRYGIKVYEKENYTSEWSGQTNNGKELPDATYYYVIEFRNGDTKTGWIYINRELGR